MFNLNSKFKKRIKDKVIPDSRFQIQELVRLLEDDKG